MPESRRRKSNTIGLYIIRRLIVLLPVTLCATLIVFLILRGLPGDATMTILSGSTHTTAMREALRAELGLDRPWFVQYVRWISGFVTGKARSFETGENLLSIIARQLPTTMLLASYATAISILVALPAGTLAAMYRNRFPDILIRIMAVGGLSTPAIWSALLILLVLARVFGWSPPLFYSTPAENLGEHLSLMIWPSLVLSYEYTANLVRITRATVSDAISEEYMRVAIAKGLSRTRAVIRYAVRNSLVPPITNAGMVFGTLIGGTVVIESVFGIPGIGRGIVQAAVARDFHVVLSHVSVLVLLYGMVNLIVDIVCMLLDPRTRESPGNPS